MLVPDSFAGVTLRVPLVKTVAKNALLVFWSGQYMP